MRTWTKLLLGFGALVAGAGIYGSVNALSPANVNGCQYLASPPTLSDLQTSVIQCDSAGKLLTTATVVPGGTQDVNLTEVGGAAVALGSTTSAASIPVVVATDQVAMAIKAASGAIASGAIASGAVASGAVASGAYASGSLAAGAGTDGWDSTQGLKADAKSTATDTTAITMMSVAKEISFMEQNPASRAVTNAGTFATQPTGTFTAADGIALTSAVKTASIGQLYNGTTDDLARSIITGTNSTGTGIAAAGLVGQCDDTTPQAITENQFGNGRINCADHGLYTEVLPTASATAGMAAVVSGSLETGHVLKNAAGNLYGVEVVTTTAAGYLEVFNSTTVPASGAVTPVASCYVVAFGTCGLNFYPPLVMATGISVAFSASTTPFTKTDSATAFLSGQVQ